MDEDYLLNKKYINKDVYKVNDKIDTYLNEQNKFRKFMENQDLDYDDINEENSIDEDLIRQEEPLSIKYQKQEKQEKRVQIRRNLEQQNYQFFDNYNFNNTLGSVNIKNDTDLNRFTLEKRYLLYVDSRNRDKTLYSEPNNYKIILKKTYTNVISIKIKSTEFTNSQQLIRNTPFSIKNNILKWKYGNNGETDDNETYTATLTPGNYSASQLSTLIENTMNSVLRSNGKLNNFTVTIDLVTDLVEFSSIDYKTISNPFSFTASETTTTIDIAYQNASNDFSIGQIVYINGSTSVGGISSSNINGSHVITFINTNSFQIIINSSSTFDVVEGGGTSVNIGHGLLFQLLFSEQKSPYQVLGFLNEDTTFGYTVSNNTELYIYKKVIIDTINSIIPSSSYSNQTLYNPIFGDYLLKNKHINDDFENIYNSINLNGKVYNIDEDVNYILSKNGNVRLSIKSISKPSIHGINSSENNIYSIITTNLPHNLNTGDRIYIFDMISKEFDNSDFSGFMEFKHLYGLSLNSNDFSISDYNLLTKYITEITNAQGLYITTDSNLPYPEYQFKINIPYVSIDVIDERIQYLIDNHYFGGSSNYDNTTFKENYLFGNILVTEVNQNLQLSGEKYILMTSSILGDGETTGDVDNVFAKIQLASSSGSNIFNAYIGGYKYFYDSPLPILNEIDIQFYSNIGELFEFYDIDHSFTLEITEAIQKIEGTGFSSQIGTKT